MRRGIAARAEGRPHARIAPRALRSVGLALLLAGGFAGAGCATCGRSGSGSRTADSEPPPAKASFWESVFDQAISTGIGNFLFRW